MRALKLLSILIILASCSSGFKSSLKSYELVDINQRDKISNNERIDSLLLPYKETMGSTMEELIIYNDNHLQKRKPESKLGNLMADILSERAEAISGINVDFASINYGGLRSTFRKGDLTLGHVFEMMPFDNEIVVLKLSGKTTKKLLEHWAFSGGIPISGISIKTDTSRQLIEAKIGGELFDANKSYYVALTDYVANGGDRCSFLSEALEYHDLDAIYREEIATYLRAEAKAGKTLNPKLEKRFLIAHE